VRVGVVKEPGADRSGPSVAIRRAKIVSRSDSGFGEKQPPASFLLLALAKRRRGLFFAFRHILPFAVRPK
jgi:hypothetical protein